jgi:thimet oligopeptidase
MDFMVYVLPNTFVGLHLSQEIRDKVKVIKKRISELSLQFSRNLGEENSVLLFSEEELSGMPYSFLEGLVKVKPQNLD